jgi:hypothetical protein
MADTKLVCGGVYEGKEPLYGRKVRAMVTSTLDEGTKDCTGMLQVKGHASEAVVQGGERLNEFNLVALPNPVSARKTSTK